MLKIVALIKRKPGLTHAEFKDYYETTHRLLVHHFADCIIDYRRSYPVQDLPQVKGEYSVSSLGDGAASGLFDCLTEVWVRDAQALAKVFERLEKAKEEFEIDEGKFIDRPSVRLVICDERNICE